MITFEDVLASDPSVEEADRDTVNKYIEIANIGFPDSRFKDGNAATAQRGRVLYVLHMLNLVVDTTAPHVQVQMTTPKPMGVKPHVWSGTLHGQQLMKLIPDPKRTISLPRVH